MRRVLIAEDDPDIREGLVDLLAEEGWSVRAARDGSEALAMLQADTPEVLLLDLRMPVMTGWELLRRLAARHPWPPCAIVVVSASADAEPLPEEVTVVGKPFRIDALLATIDRVTATATPTPSTRGPRGA